MKKYSSFRFGLGFSLLEVLVAVAVLSFGLLALATLQISLMRDSSDTKSRSIALSLAKDQLEKLRNFKDLTGYQNLQNGSTMPVVVGGVSYAPTWDVSRYVFNQDLNANGILNESSDQQFVAYGTDVGATPTSPAGFVANNEFKQIKVSVTWTDAQNALQTVAMEDAVAALAPTDGALIAKTNATSGTRRIPAIINDPALDAMVIPIALGGGVNSAATNPKPQVVVGTSVVETKFDVYTYANLSGGTATAQALVETVLLGCTCDVGTANAAAFNKRPTYWDGIRYTVPLAATYTAQAGADAAAVNLQSPRCNICCRDHHDPVGVEGATFSPRLVTKSSSNIVTAKHLHYLDKTAPSPADSGTYKEACRLIRVDGIMRVATDLSNDYFGLLATGNGTTALTPIPDSTSVAGTPPVTGAVARYQKFVLGYLAGRYVAPTPSDSSAKTTYNTIGTPETLAASAPYVLDNPASIDIELTNSTGKWLHSRGLYVDYIEQEAVDAIKAAKIDAGCTVDTATLNACVLKLLPFTSVNLSEIADWTPLSGALVVTNFDYSTSISSTDPVRGKVTSNTNTSQTVTASSLSRISNTGLLDLSFDSISALDDFKATDTQAFAIGGGPSSDLAGDGVVYVTPSGYTGTNTPAVSHLVPPALTTVSCGLSAGVYTCNVDGSATTGLDVNNGVKIDIGNYNHQQAVAGQSTPTLSGCLATGTATGLPALSSSGYTYTGSVCKNYQVTGVTAPATAGTATWAPAPSSAGDGTVLPLPGEVTRISFPGYLSAGSAVSVALGLQATTVQVASSCSYICSSPGQQNSTGTACKNNSPPVFTAVFPACL